MALPPDESLRRVRADHNSLGRPRPPYLSTVVNLGLNNTPGMPNLMVGVCESHKCNVGSYRFRDHSTHLVPGIPPSRPHADRVQEMAGEVAAPTAAACHGTGPPSSVQVVESGLISLFLPFWPLRALPTASSYCNSFMVLNLYPWGCDRCLVSSDSPFPDLNARTSTKKVSEVIFERQAHEIFFRDLAGVSVGV